LGLFFLTNFVTIRPKATGALQEALQGARSGVAEHIKALQDGLARRQAVTQVLSMHCTPSSHKNRKHKNSSQVPLLSQSWQKLVNVCLQARSLLELMQDAAHVMSKVDKLLGELGPAGADGEVCMKLASGVKMRSY
jgi:hypothetical protein